MDAQYIKAMMDMYSDGYKDAAKKIYNYLFRKENTKTEEFKEYGVIHIFEDDFKAFIKEEFKIDVEEQK